MTYGPYNFWYSWTGRSKDIDRDKVFKVGSGQEYNTVVPPPLMLHRHIEKGNGLPIPCSVLVRRTAFQTVGGFEDNFPGMYDDEALFAKLAINYPIYLTADCWGKYRQHDNSFCARAIRNGEWDAGRDVPSRDRVRYLYWLASYVENCSQDLGPALLAVIYRRIRDLREE